MHSMFIPWNVTQWYDSKEMWNEKVLAFRQIYESTVPTLSRRAYASMLWPAQWVFVGGWAVMRDICHVSTTTPTWTISGAFWPRLHLPQCQPHRAHIGLWCVSTVIILYADRGPPNGCLVGVGVFKCGGYLPLQHHANAQGCEDMPNLNDSELPPALGIFKAV